MLYCMRGDLDLEWWDMMTDENIGGGSKCKLKTSENGLSMMWFGILENKPPELDWGKTSAWKSFATLYTKPWTRDYGRADKLNIEEHNCFEVRLRVVQTQAILFLKSMSERVGSDKGRL